MSLRISFKVLSTLMKCLSLDWSLSLVSKDRWTIFVASIVSKILQFYYELSHYELSALPIVAPTNGRHYELSSYEWTGLRIVSLRIVGYESSSYESSPYELSVHLSYHTNDDGQIWPIHGFLFHSKAKTKSSVSSSILKRTVWMM